MVVRRIPESELYHHGILGMHWGVRRYQNNDGTLTAAGRKKKKVGLIQTYKNKKKGKELQKAKAAKKAEREEKEKIINSY